MRHLLQAVGISVSVLGAAGCGGKVVVDVDGAGGSTTTSTVTSTTFTCDVPASVYSAIPVCVSPVPSTGCWAIGEEGLVTALVKEIESQGCGGGDLAGILCGPDPTATDACCYQVDAIIYECGGRPFVVGGAARVAPVVDRGDWTARFEGSTAGLDPVTRAALADAWTRSALDEHASVASFARFALELLAVGAPADLVMMAQRAMGDEIRHAERCFGLASAYADRAVGPGALAMDCGAGARVDLAEIAAAAVREGCVGETLAAFGAAAARDEAQDPAVRAALDEIARDEAEHAALAFRFVAWALKQGDARVRGAVEAAFGEALRAAPMQLPDGEGDAGVLRAHGQLPAGERRALAARCLDEVVGPCARALLREAHESIAEMPAAQMV
ncbi:MAG: ferritin-like domain-containing protein [Minicystis sp.]